MNRRVVAIAVSLLALASIVFAGSHGMPQLPENNSSTETKAPAKEKKYVDMKSDGGQQIDKKGQKILIAVGNFAAHHNGTVITCDSTVRHSDSHIECFGNVLIKKGTIYIYGDRAEYDGEKSEAHIYSDIVKVVDRGTTLYTYNFRFNTESNIGEYKGGGVVLDGDTQLESLRGYYYADNKEVICVDAVQMRNETYRMKGDSVIYNTEKNTGKFFTRTNIWNTEDNDYLYADQGSFDSNENRYTLTLNGYVLTEKQEIWSDTLDYYSDRGYALMRNNVQLDDQKQKLLAFGDWVEYWKEPGNAFMTREPSLISYDKEQGDSVFICSDSMYLYTRDPVRERLERLRADSLAQADTAAKLDNGEEKSVEGENKVGAEPANEEAVKPAAKKKADMADAEGVESQRKSKREKSMSERANELRRKAAQVNAAAKAKIGEDKEPMRESVSAENSTSESGGKVLPDSLPRADSLGVVDSLKLDSLKVDSLAADSLVNPLDTLTAKERKAMRRDSIKAAQKVILDSIKRVKADSLAAKLDRIADERQAKRTAYYKKLERQDSIYEAKLKQRADARLRKAMERLTRKGVHIAPVHDSLLVKADMVIRADSVPHDAKLRRTLDSLIAIYYPKSEQDSTNMAADTVAVDSTYREIKAFSRVKMFRTDFQMVCDSLAMTTIDSIIHLHRTPILWNEDNQITSEIMHIITAGGNITRAEFEGKPMTVAEIDTAHYNQVTGKQMVAHFRNNAVYRNDVDGNVQTIYYVQEQFSPEPTMMAYVEAGDMSSYIENGQLASITYRTNPTYWFYPIDKIPADRSTKLQGFTWQPERRPVRDSVFKRTLRESVRKEKEELILPQFPISAAMERRKERLLKAKTWRDRTDTLSYETIEWVESVREP